MRGTTPTITYRFKVVDPVDSSVAYLTISQAGQTMIEKTLEEATVGEDSLEWTLTQEETLLLKVRPDAEMQLRYRLLDGSAHKTKVSSLTPGKLLKDGEI